MRRLRQHPPTLQQQTKLPRRPPPRLLLVDLNRIQQPAPPYLLDERRVQGADGGAEERAEGGGARGELLVGEDGEGGEGDSAGEGVPGEGA
jgi:hypothetical protein